jgi:ABC-2 type transport system ATP-binding protein
MKRKLALLQVLLPETPLLLLDEPTNTLDPTMREELLRQLVAARKRGQAVLFSSHVLSEVEQVCDRVAILKEGRLVFWQCMAELRDSRRVRVRLSDHEPLPSLPGLDIRAQHDGEVELAYTGPLPKLLDWLSGRSVEDVRIEPLGLAPIYQRYHAAE